jgi:hypothetical protein
MSVERRRLTSKGLSKQKILDGMIVYLKDFSMVNPVKICEALNKGGEDED